MVAVCICSSHRSVANTGVTAIALQARIAPLILGGYNKISDYAIQTGRATHNRAAAVPKIVHSADKRRVKHHSALPVAEMGIFLRCLEEYTNRKTALLPRLLILTLTCSGEVRTKPPKPSE